MRKGAVGSEAKIEVSEELSNVVENLACRLAENAEGRVTAHHLVPYVPMSLELISTCLDAMVDGSSVLSEEQDGIAEYIFTAYQDRELHHEPLQFDACVSCGKDLQERAADILCTACEEQVDRELKRLADRNAWPAQAVYEHEILYLAANHGGPVHAEDLAGKSRYTLRSMRRKVDRLSVDGFIRQGLDPDSALITYHFPAISYSKEQFRKNMSLIRQHPASLQEEMEIRVVRIFVTLGLMVLGMLVLAFMHVPFPFLVIGFLVAAPIVSFLMLKHRSSPVED